MSANVRFATFLAPSIYPVYQAVAEYVAKALHCRTSLAVGSSFDEFARGETDAGFICGLPYVQLMRQRHPPVEPLAAPVLMGDRYAGRPIYFSDVVVSAESPVRSFDGLRGRSWAYNDPASQSGYGVVRYHLVEMGESHGFFGHVVESGYHYRSLRLVCDGEVDGSAIDCQVLAVELRDHPELREHIRVIGSLGTSTIQPIVAATRLPAALRSDLRAALLAMHTDPTARERLGLGFVERFAPIADADYNDIRVMLAACERVGFLTLR